MVLNFSKRSGFGLWTTRAEDMRKAKPVRTMTLCVHPCPQLAPALPISSHAPVAAASPSLGHVIWMMTVGTALTNQTLVVRGVVAVRPSWALGRGNLESLCSLVPWGAWASFICRSGVLAIPVLVTAPASTASSWHRA